MQKQMLKKNVQIEKDQIAIMHIKKLQRAWRNYQFSKAVDKILKRKKCKKYIADELLITQRKYCEHLKMMVEQVMKPSQSMIEDDQLHQLMFSELSQIYQFHYHFLQKLQHTMSGYNYYKTKLSTVIIDLFNQPTFQLKYSNYCANYRKSNKLAKLLFTTNASINSLFKSVGVVNENTLESYLITPMQRLCKYELILNNYYKNTEEDHCDYQGIESTIVVVQNLVKQTNQSVQQFLLADHYRLLKQYNGQILSLMPNPNRKLIHAMHDISEIDLTADKETQYRQLSLFNDSLLLLPDNNSTKPIFINLYYIRDLPNLKYFKNLIQLINSDKYLTLKFKRLKQKQSFMQKLKKTDIYKGSNKFIGVKVLGTELRESLLKTFTVYIVQIIDKQNIRTIYPRFKDLIKIQQIINKKVKMILPCLHKQSLFSTLKSKTVERRKLAIQQFLQRILNNPQCDQITQIMQILKLKTQGNKQSGKQTNDKQLSISLPGGQTITVLIDINSSNVSNLKEAIVAKLGLIYAEEFEIFQVRNKARRLLYKDQPVSEIYMLQEESIRSMNPFKENIEYLFTRHHYLEPEDEFELFKNDFVRTQLELSVIKSDIRTYKLEEELMITFMCLFAMYINLPISQDKQLSSFLKSTGKKQYKVTPQEFKVYYTEVAKKVMVEEDEMITIPFLIIKIMNNSFLYQCQQFEVTVHSKSFKIIKSQIPGLQEKVILAIKRSYILLLTVESKHIVQSFPMSSVQISEMHPTAIVLKLQGIDPSLRLDTQQGFEISRLLDIYKTG